MFNFQFLLDVSEETLIFSFGALDSHHLLQLPNLVASSSYLHGFDYAILNTSKLLKFF